MKKFWLIALMGICCFGLSGLTGCNGGGEPGIQAGDENSEDAMEDELGDDYGEDEYGDE
ncbi:MAG: hypothetical protein AAGA03_02105 [Planctomycetota bacterium]